MRALQSLLSVLPLVGLSSAHTHISGVPIPRIKALFSTVDPAFCSSQTSAVSCLNDGPGTSYCSSYLNIPTATLCTTIFVANTAQTGTTTTYVLSGAYKKRDATSEPAATETQAHPITAAPPLPTEGEVSVRTEWNTPSHRPLVPRQVNQCIPTTGDAPFSTNLCSCLSIPTPTSTTTYYQTMQPSVVVTQTVTTNSLPPNPNANLAFLTVTHYGDGPSAYTSTVSTNFGPMTSTVVIVNVPNAALSTSYRTGGTTGYTYTAQTTVNGAASSFVIVNAPAGALQTSTRTAGTGSYVFTTATTVNGVPTTYAVENVPAPPLSTSFQTGGTASFTYFPETTINGQATTYAVVNVPAPILSTSTRSQGTGSYVLTTTATVNGAPTTYAILNLPAGPLSTSTRSSGTVSYVFTTATTINGVPSSYAVANVPTTPFSISTRTTGSASATTYTVTSTNLGGAGTADDYTTTYIQVVVPTPPLSTYTRTSGYAPYTSTVSTAINGQTTQAVIVNRPALSHVVVVDFQTGNDYGYLDVSTNPVSGGTGHTAVVNADYASSGLFYIDPTTNMLTLDPSNNVSSVPLYSQCRSGVSDAQYLFDTDQNSVYSNVATTYWSDGTLHLTNQGNSQYLAVLCDSVVYITGDIPSGCRQVSLSLVQNQLSFRSTTVTSGSVATQITYVQQGSAVSNGGVVTYFLPTGTANPTACTSTGITYTVYENPAQTGSTPQDPKYANFVPSNFAVPARYAQDFSGQTDNIALDIASPGNGYVYNYPYTVQFSQNAIMFHGYFYANVTGTWTFSLRQPDDVGYVWLGTKAINTWTNSNFDLQGALQLSTATTTLSLTSGSYTPIRLLFGNGAGAVSYTLYITDPNNRQYSNTAGFFRLPCGQYNWN